MGILICPNCGEVLTEVPEQRVFRCGNNHSFDMAKEGYVNLIVGSKSGENRGDSRASARARHEFLEKGYYGCLKQEIQKRLHGVVLDICCGEGYYDVPASEAAAQQGNTTSSESNAVKEPHEQELAAVTSFYGFDLSKEMVRLAAKRGALAERGRTVEQMTANCPDPCPSYQYFVANLASIPVADHSVDVCMHLFAPFNAPEFSRVLKPDGVLYSVIPGENHLYELKEVVYDTPYKNDEQAPDGGDVLQLMSRTKVSERIHVPREDLMTLFSMTPYYYRSSEQDRKKLEQVESLDLTVEFIILEYKHK